MSGLTEDERMALLGRVLAQVEVTEDEAEVLVDGLIGHLTKEES